MKPALKKWLFRLSGLLILAHSLWAVYFYTSQRLASGDTFKSLVIAPAVYLVEIVLLAGFAALLPWLRLKHTPVLLWITAGLFAALALTDLWTVGYYLSPAFILGLVNAAYLNPSPNPITWRSFWIFILSGAEQFSFSLAPFIIRWIF